MSPPVVAFFNNKGGVGKTTLVYHLAWMMARQGLTVLASDLDPQANLTANFLDEEELERLWPTEGQPDSRTVYGCLAPLIRGVGDVAEPRLEHVDESLYLLAGDLELSRFEDDLSSQWPECLDGKERAFRVISAFWRLLAMAAQSAGADLVLVDVGPNLGAINRAAMIAADHVVFPLAPDLFSVRGLINLGPTLRTWRTQWHQRLSRNPDPLLHLPDGSMHPAGYVVLGHGVRLNRPVQAYQRWMAKMPGVYRTAVLDTGEPAPTVDDDPHCLAQLKHYHSLIPMSYEARKPVFDLKPADGAFGGHQVAVGAAREDFHALAKRILDHVGVPRG